MGRQTEPNAATRCVVVLLAAILVAATACSSGKSNGSAVASTVPPKASPDVVGSASEEFFADTFSSIWGGFASSGGHTAYSWMLGMFGMSGGQDAAIESQLSQIQQELVQLNETLADVDTAILQQTCDQMYGDVAPSIARLDLLWTEYQTLLGWNAGTDQFSNPPNMDTADIDAWIADASGTGANPGPSVLSALTTLQTYLNSGGSGADSTITACIKAIGSNSTGSGLPAPGSLDDRPYYSDVVQPVLDYYYGYQLQAVTMYIEMSNYQAWQAAGSPTTGDPTTVAQTVCPGTTAPPHAPAPPSPTPTYQTAGPGESPQEYCELAYNFTVTANQQIRFQWAQAGAPYSTDQYQLQNGTTNLWVLDLNAFTKSLDGSCTNPLPSWPACGPTAATYADMAKLSYGPYTSWTAASADQLGHLVNADQVSTETSDGVTIASKQPAFSSGTLGSLLESRGLQNVGDWIVLTPTTNSDVVIGTYVGYVDVDGKQEKDAIDLKANTVCFAATALEYTNTGTQPFCSGWGDFQKLTTSYEHMCSSNQDDEHVETACYLPGDSYGNFFNIDWKGGSDWDPSPYWRLETATSSSYHWPVVDVSTLTCSTTEPGAAALNPAGVPSMCGSDLTAYLDTQVPPPTAS